MTDKINIIIADDHKLFAEGLHNLLNGIQDIDVIDIVSDGRQLLGVLDQDSDAIILLDIKMPYLNGLDAAIQIEKIAPMVKIIILSTYQEWHLIQKAKQFGCKGYLTKTADKDELIDVIRRVNAGELCFQKIENSKTIMEEDDIVKKYKLTRRELEILELLKQELTNKGHFGKIIPEYIYH